MFLKRLISAAWFTLSILLTSCNGAGPTSNALSDKANSVQGSAFDKGKTIYSKTCIACHLSDGKGIANTFPPLEKSDFLVSSKDKAIEQVIKGKVGEITVNGMTYNNIMPPQGLSDEDVADVLTYVYGSFGNNGQKVTVEEVKSVRATLK